MKTLSKILVITMFFTSSFCNAQETMDITSTYRVTAIKKGENAISSLSNEVETHPNLTVYIPNAFTPNSDGLNDTFGPLGYGIKNFSITIYDRWGELIFESDDTNKPWNGTYLGQKVQPGSYVYNIQATGFRENKFQQEGTVSIVKS